MFAATLTIWCSKVHCAASAVVAASVVSSETSFVLAPVKAVLGEPQELSRALVLLRNVPEVEPRVAFRMQDLGSSGRATCKSDQLLTMPDNLEDIITPPLEGESITFLWMFRFIFFVY